MRFKDKLSFIAFQIILRFKSYHQIIKSKLWTKSNSNQIKPFVLFCFVLSCFVLFCLMIMIAVKHYDCETVWQNVFSRSRT